MNPADRHRRAMDIFDEVCDLPPERRDEVLADRCGDDAELRTKVESMLRLDGAADPFVAAGESGRIVAEFVAAGDEATEQREATPERIGPYRIIRKIGEGGMGIIYEAEQESPRRRVALKILRPGMFGRSMLKRFQHEAHVLGQLQHPGIAHIHEAGIAESPQGRQPFFVMEYIDGAPLDEHAKTQQLDIRQRIELLARVCDAVQHAHQRGVIHRDLKPSNILVERRDDTTLRTPTGTSASNLVADAIGQPKVLDFGIARVTDAEQQLVTLRTEVGQLVGTLAYMCPEQVAGNSDDIDTRCDVYALGVILYQLVVGKRPLDLIGLHMTEAARIIREQEPTRAGAIEKHLRGDVETMIAKAMAKDRERRYASAAEFAADLRRHLANEPIEARPASTLYQLGKFARRNKGLVGGLVATFVMLIVALVGTSYGLIKADHRRAEAEEARSVAEAREQQVRTVADFQADILSKLDPMVLGKQLLSGMRGEIETGLRGLDLDADRVADDLAQFDRVAQAANPTNVAMQILHDGILMPAKVAIDTGFADQPIVRAKLYHSLGTTCASLGYADLGTEMLQRSVELFRGELGRDDAETLAAMRELAAATGGENPQLSLSQWQETLTGMTEIYGANHELTLGVRAELGRMQYELGQLEQAEQSLTSALADARTNLGDDNLATATILEYMGGLTRRRDEPKEAENYLRQALAIYDRVAPNGEAAIRAHNNLGDLLREAGKFEEAEKQLRSAYEALRERLGDEHPNTLLILNNLGGFLAAQGRFDEAREIAQKVLATQERTLGANHPDTLRSRQNLAGIYYRTGHPAEALAALRAVLDGRRAVLGSGHPATLMTTLTYGSLLRITGDLEQSQAVLHEACEAATRSLPEDHVLLDDIRSSLILTQQLRGAWSESEPYCRQLASARRAAPDVDDAALASALQLLGAAMVFQNQFDDAEPIIRESIGLYTKSDHAGDWSKHEASSLLGMVLIGKRQYADAEPIMLTAYDGLQAGLASADPTRRDWWLNIVREQIAQMYEESGHPERLEQWSQTHPDEPETPTPG
ncbi:MAG: serine/threonine protein kinase [Phycisphaerales bacterium]|nr:serine/threonine protein kinase [Phycisphaerales bacterium]